MAIKIRCNGIRPDNVVADFEIKTTGGGGHRETTLSGWAKDEVQARHMLLLQARAMRDELNLAIEDMIGQIITARAQL